MKRTVYQTIHNCEECQSFKMKGFFISTPYCKRMKKALPYTDTRIPVMVTYFVSRSSNPILRIPTGVIPSECPLPVSKEKTDEN